MRYMLLTALLLGLLGFAAISGAQTTTNFTYQGYLEDGGVPANGTYDFYFQLFDLLTLGTQQGTNRYAPDTAVVNGQFTVLLDWGYSVFPGAPRFLEIYVRPGASTGAYTKLTPRQQLTPVPYALAALNAWRLGGNPATIPGANFLGTTDDKALEFKVNSSRVLRLEPNATSPNILGGFPGNSITPGAYGSIIAGGGYSGFANTIYDHYCTISGGIGNQAGNGSNGLWWSYATVGGGGANQARGNGSTIAGGLYNQAYGVCATVPGGTYAYANGDYSYAAGRYAKALHTGAFVWADSSAGDFSSDADNQFKVRAGGGVKFDVGNGQFRLLPGNQVLFGDFTNSIAADAIGSSIGGGSYNIVTDYYCNIAGGYENTVGNSDNNYSNVYYAFVGGGGYNAATATSATVTGGYSNSATADNATVGGGFDNTASGYNSTVAGGFTNAATNSYAVVGGGGNNSASATSTTVAGGYQNAATATDATVGGGYLNTAGGYRSVVAGGNANTTSGQYSTIAGGYSNDASGNYSTVAGGNNNTASGVNAFVAGGNNNIASGLNSFAAGNHATANKKGSFVWLDSASDNTTNIPNENEVFMRASGGFYIHTNTTGTGAALYAGSGSWSTFSDRNGKTEITALEPQAVLNKLLAIPISRWRYKTEAGGVYHFGPMAQDFYAAFQLGPNDTSITTVDADGVAFAAIQGLYQQTRKENAALKARIASLEQKAAKVDALEARLAALERLLNSGKR